MPVICGALPSCIGKKKRDAACINELYELGQSYYVLPLQLNSDAQIRDHSHFDNMQQVISHVMHSFALHASSNTKLIIKNHPLDMGLEDYPAYIQRLSQALDLQGRVDYLESGDLNSLLEHARGLVTVNSTAGGLAVSLGCPTITLSDPIYNLPGLTFQGDLDDFWYASEPPSMALLSRFRNTVIHTSQLNGGFLLQSGQSFSDWPMRAALSERCVSS
ncbi:hypothetical protein [Deefgea sp. CFH1-16]|uniref:capsular polysaccharide export protein, LipB/KpsS family n=1 Tax=Deefgea sp. CFH1-16 TaxID=2675457 RepID=UPI00194034B5|nr:hypothetical protein [Deefgea sp. CFH1-16]